LSPACAVNVSSVRQMRTCSPHGACQRAAKQPARRQSTRLDAACGVHPRVRAVGQQQTPREAERHRAAARCRALHRVCKRSLDHGEFIRMHVFHRAAPARERATNKRFSAPR
jgi:hypothetical protein